MREPFDLPAGCSIPDLSVPFDLGDLPYCSIPGITTPTAVLDVFPPPIDLPVPECPCIPTFLGTWAAYPTMGTRGMRGRAVLRNNTRDCCDPELRLDLSMTMPCMPMDAEFDMTVRRWPEGTCPADAAAEFYDPPRFSAGGAITMRTGCELGFELDVAAPCLPFNLAPSVVIRQAAHRHNLPAARVFANMRIRECTIEMPLHIDLPADACPVVRIGQRRARFAGSQFIADYVGQVVSNRGFVQRVDTITVEVLTRLHNDVTRYCTEPGGDIITRIGRMAYNTYRPTTLVVTRLSRQDLSAAPWPLVARMTMPIDQVCGARGTNYLGIGFDLSIPIIPCPRITVHSKKVSVSPNWDSPEMPTMLAMSYGRRRGDLYTCKSTMTFHMMLPQFVLSATSDTVDYHMGDPDITVWWSKVREYRRRLHVRLRFVDGLTDCLEYVADIVADGAGGLNMVKERACYKRGVLYTVHQLGATPLLQATDCP